MTYFFLSESEIGLNNMLETLSIFSSENGLRVNLLKTTVMIFNQNGRHIRKTFTLGGKRINTTRHYKYLGFIVTPSGEIHTGLNDLRDRSMKAFFKMKNKLGPLFQKQPLLTLKLFDTLIKPILLYCSDFWGILKLPKNNPIEIVQNSVYKQILGVQKQTTTIGVLMELGQYPLSLYAKQAAIKNWIRISKLKKANELVHKSFSFAVSQNYEWPNRVLDYLSQMGMADTYNKNVTMSYIHTIFKRMCDIYQQNSFAEIQKEESKLRTYSIIKTTYGFENYLNDVKKLVDRINLTKLRLSNHVLNIEKGRHNKIHKNLRFCPFCKTVVEDEIHTTIDCKTYKHLREGLYRSLGINEVYLQHIENRKKFTLIFSQPSNNNISKYVSKIFELRTFLINNHKNLS